MVTTLTLTGRGDTKEAAFNQIFGQIKQAIAKEIHELVIRIEPQEIEILAARETVYTERFLGILFPRRRTKYEIQAKVGVRLGVILLSQISFTQEQEGSAQKILANELMSQR